MNYYMNYLMLFIMGGSMFVLIKYLSTHVDIKYSSMVAAFPLGLLTGLVITNNKIFEYSIDYSKNVFILLLSSIIQYILLKFKFNRYLTLFISILSWVSLNSINIIAF